jgi:hypothetical protein
MDIINKYFEFKKTSLIEYSSVFMNSKIASSYITDFINTYINTYYFHLLDTYYENEVLEYNDQIIVKELNGKRLELLEETNKIEDEKEKQTHQKLINDCYKSIFIAIIIDLNNFTYCNKLSEFRETLKTILIENNSIAGVRTSTGKILKPDSDEYKSLLYHNRKLFDTVMENENKFINIERIIA